MRCIRAFPFNQADTSPDPASERLPFSMLLASLCSLVLAASPPPIVPITSIHPDHPENSDLLPVVEHIGEARFVFLSATTFDDGAALWALTRLTRHLCADAGFSAVVFDSGLYDARAMHAQFVAGTDPTLAAPVGLPDALGRSAFTATLWRDIWRSYLTPHPIAVAGISPALTGARSPRQLPRELLNFLGLLDPHPLSREERQSFLTVLERLRDAPNDELEGAKAWQELNRVRSLLAQHRDALAAASSTLDVQRWERVLDDRIVDARNAMAAAGSGETAAQQHALIRRAAEHLLWLADAELEGRRIIVWVQNLDALARPAEMEPADRINPRPSVAGLVRDARPGQVRSIATISIEGVRGALQQEPFELPLSRPGSLEAALDDLDVPFAFVDLANWDHAVATDVTRSFLLNKGQDTESARAVWSRQFDGLLFIRTAFPNGHTTELPPGAAHTVHDE